MAGARRLPALQVHFTCETAGARCLPALQFPFTCEAAGAEIYAGVPA